ncbi:hypothetical protein EV127DRAFT_255307 [Xylaria flabelliformis]|nr:hypothetical protein EV127DRAFT_255307 [Xylaria flabelliformis]
MSNDVTKDAKRRGFAIQCPWSKCFPQLYDNSRAPCVQTPFADFREISDHIWKYHSFLLSCDKCDYRFKSSRRGENVRQDLERQKSKHNDEFHSGKSNNIPKNSRDFIRTMTEEQDKILKSWKADKGKDKGMVESNYRSLCSSLFGNGIGVPTNIQYNYYIAEYKTNPESARQGERNEEYFTRCRVAAQPGSTAGFPQQLSPSPYQLSLDEPSRPDDWIVPKTAPDQDSGYGSKPSTETAPSANNGVCNNPNWSYNPGWYPSNDNAVAFTNFFDEALNYHYPSDIEMGDQNWELGNSDGPKS